MEYEDCYVKCELCHEKPGSNVVGGIWTDGKRGLWMCCDDCKQKINDERKKHRPEEYLL